MSKLSKVLRKLFGNQRYEELKQEAEDVVEGLTLRHIVALASKLRPRIERKARSLGLPGCQARQLGRWIEKAICEGAEELLRHDDK